MSWGDHFDAATTDRTDLELWDKQVPRANVGISPDENFCFLETDDEAALKEACKDLPSEIWDTSRVSARQNRCYYIFRQTMRTRKAGNMTIEREGEDNLFEFKQHRVYVTAPGSIHPKTGKPYGVEWRLIPAMPDVLLNRLCELYGAPNLLESHRHRRSGKSGKPLTRAQFCKRYNLKETTVKQIETGEVLRLKDSQLRLYLAASYGSNQPRFSNSAKMVYDGIRELGNLLAML